MSSLGYEILSKEKLEVLTKLAEGYFNKGGMCTSDQLVGAFALLRSHDVFGFYARMVGELDSIPLIEVDIISDETYEQLIKKHEDNLLEIRMDMANYPQIFRILKPYPKKVLDKSFARAKKSAIHERTKKYIKEMELLRKEVDLLEERNVLDN